jgi:hypothetical protein
MIVERTRTRGQPLVVLCALLLGWAGARVTSRGGQEGLSFPEAVLTVGTATAAQAEKAGGIYRVGPQSYPAADVAMAPAWQAPTVQYVPMWYGPRPPGAYGRTASYAQTADSAGERYGRDEPHFYGDFPQDGPIRAADRSNAAQFSKGLPPLHTGAPATRYGEPAALLGGRLGRLIGDPARWSMDAWALIRDNGDKIPSAGTLPATYGASQAGAVLRYRLSLRDRRQLTAYLRTTSTVGGLSETSAALGLSARPLPAVPILAAVEGRVTEQGGMRRVQPAAMAVTALPPLALPGSLRAEVYAQGGYVGGRYATPFADGQIRVDRPLATLGRIEARVGAGAWGGIQKGASRLDAGPGATVSMPLSPKVFGRFAVDWRFRVAGNAEPDSGPALTVAAGF